MLATRSYIEERNGTYYVPNKRVRLFSVIYEWNNGSSPETIADNFPVLDLAEVYGAITFYLDHRAELDAHFVELLQRENEIRAAHEATYDAKTIELRQRIAALLAQRRASHP